MELRDCYEGIDALDIDRVVLDLFELWRVVGLVEVVLNLGGILCVYMLLVM